MGPNGSCGVLYLIDACTTCLLETDNKYPAGCELVSYTSMATAWAQPDFLVVVKSRLLLWSGELSSRALNCLVLAPSKPLQLALLLALLQASLLLVHHKPGSQYSLSWWLFVPFPVHTPVKSSCLFPSSLDAFCR